MAAIYKLKATILHIGLIDGHEYSKMLDAFYMSAAGQLVVDLFFEWNYVISGQML